MATVVYHHPFDSESDATKLRDALRGLGTEDDIVIQILGFRTNEQRLRIMETYKALFDEDLKRKMLGDLSGNFRRAMEHILMPTADYYTNLVYQAITKSSDNEDLLEILCTITNSQILQIKDLFHAKYEKTLEDSIRDDTSGAFKHMLLMICKAARNEGVVCLEKVRADAEALFEAGEAQWEADEAAFNTLFAFESYEHLRFVFQEYEDITGRSLFEAIEAETAGDLRKALLTIVRCVENTPAYFARKLNKAFKSPNVDVKIIMRIIISRCEIDMVFIKSEYEKRFKERLDYAVQKGITGDLSKLLIALVTN